jgi:hypothetical protein
VAVLAAVDNKYSIVLVIDRCYFLANISNPNFVFGVARTVIDIDFIRKFIFQ